MHSLFRKKGELKKERVYICTKLSIISSNLDDYKNNDYQAIASYGLNTGEKKYLFSEKDMAISLLHKKGTLWCVYEVNVPEKLLDCSLGNGTAIILGDYKFRPEDIVNINFHILFQPSTLSEGKSSFEHSN
jgi:hypothetical protein